jgi:hypothetical protein
MTDLQPTIEDWKKLYDAAIRIKEASPWQWMDEIDIFGVRNPETRMTGFVSVMGSIGEHFAVAVYLGSEGLFGFWNIYEREEPMDIEAFFEIPQLQLSFENRDFLEKEDLNIIRKLGLRFHGNRAWPMFRSYRPGFYPWFLEAHEATFLTHVLEQTLHVALRFKADETLLYPEDDPLLNPQPEIDNYLVRTCRKESSGFIWEDSTVPVLPPTPTFFNVEIDSERIITLRSMPVRKGALEMDFFMFPVRIGPRGTRPSIPYMLMIVDAKSGMIVGHELLEAKPSKALMYGGVPEHVINLMIQVGYTPDVIKVRSDLLHSLLEPLSGELRFELVKSHVLRKLDKAREAMLESLA